MRDRCLAEALIVHDDSLNELGIPSWIARDPQRSWMLDEVNDLAMAELEAGREEMGGGKGKNFGVRLTVVQSDQPHSAKVAPAEPKVPGDESLG